MNHALASLARRDHSRNELKLKLLAKGHEALEVERVLDECEAKGYLNDSRYGASVVRSSVLKGHGAARARQTMIAKGLDKEVIQTNLEGCDVDWYAQARAKALKKFGATKPVDAKDRAKRIRYLAGQGFSFDEISHALDFDPYDMD
ncbi:regulatory protein RecX [Shewanella khirikhana]|uniref:regulatory protein RecX n=1 Tax=Shewanella khirikhana TaxID=1965282 RepID=UPI0030CC6AC5